MGEAEQEFMKQLQSNPPRIVEATTDLISWMRSTFGEPIWWYKKECWVSVRGNGLALFGLCPGRYPDDPAHNKAVLSIRRIPGYEDLVEKLITISPLVESLISHKRKIEGFNIHLDQLKNVDEFKLLKEILQDHVAKLGSYIEESKNQATQSVPKEQIAIVPTEDDFASAYRMLVRLGESVSIDMVLDQIEINAKKNGRSLEEGWRMITEKSIEIWSKKP